MDNLSENIKESKVNYSFCKDERLCSKKVIDKLFLEGKSIFSYPFKIVYLEFKLPSKYPVQVGFSVGKRNFKKAVHRNLIKRRMREAYRLNKSLLYNILDERQLAVFFIFTEKTIPEYRLVEEGMKKGIGKLIKEISKDKKRI